jgi:PKD repeat protein
MKKKGNSHIVATFVLVASALLFLTSPASRAAAYTTATGVSIQTTAGTTNLDLSKGSGSSVQYANGVLELTPGSTEGYYVLNPVTIAPNSLLSVSGTQGDARVSYLFSANGSTWYAFADGWYDDSGWTSMALSGSTYGNDPDNNSSDDPWPVGGISSSDWSWLMNSTGRLYIAVLLYGTPPPPSVAPPTVTLSGPSTILAGTSATVQATVTSDTTPVTETWTLPDGTTASGTSVSYTSKVSDGNTLTFKFTAYLSAYPAYSTTKTFTVTNVTKPQNLTLTGPGTATLGDTDTYTASATTPMGTVAYTFTLPDGSTVNSNTASYTFTPSYSGTISVKAYISGYPALSDTKSMNVSISYPAPTVSVTCPSSLYTYQPGTCTATASAPYGTIMYLWTVDGASISSSGNTASLTIPTAGSHTVTVTAYLKESPATTANASASVNVQATTINAAITCPSAFWTTVAGSCTVKATSSWGTPAYNWSTTGATITQQGNTAAITYTATGQRTVQVVAYLQEAGPGAVTSTQTAAVTVNGLTAPTDVVISGPDTAELGSTQTYTVSAQAAAGTLAYTITLPDGSTLESSTATYTFPADAPASNVIKATAYLEENPGLSATASKTTTALYPAPTVSVTCPSSLYTYQPGTCTATASAPYGTIMYLWAVDGTSIGSSQDTASLTIPTAGSHTVTVTAYLKESPSTKAEASASVDVQATTINAALTCPSTFWTTVADTCTVTATSNWGTPSYHWNASPAMVKPNGNSASLTYLNSGSYTPQVVVSLQEAPAASTTQTAQVNVIGFSVPTNVRISGPTTADLGSTQTYTVSAQATAGTLVYTITLPDGSTVNSNTATYTFTTADVGRAAISAKVSVKEAPGTISPVIATMFTTVHYPAPQITGITCPDALYTYQSGTCTAVATAPYGTVEYAWTAGNASAGSDQKASLFFRYAGSQKVTLKAYIKEDPSSSATTSANVSVTATSLTASLDCPATMLKSETAQCKVTLNTNWGTPVYTWISYGGTVTVDGGNASITYATPGYKSVLVTASLKEAPALQVRTSAPITVTWITTPRIAIRQTPAYSAYADMPVSYEAIVTCPSGCNDVQWSINGQSFTGPAVSTSFTGPGKQTVTATVAVKGFESYSDAVAKTTGYTTVYAIPKPRAGITAPYYAEGGVPFSLKGVVFSPVPTTGYWTLPDGSTVDGDTLTYTANQPTSTELTFRYTASVTGHPDISTTVSKNVYVKVYNFPKFTIRSATGDGGYTPYTLLCGPSADYSGISGFSYTLNVHWDFGDGTVEDTSRTNYVSHMYTASGVYPVTMTVTDDRGNTSTDTTQITVQTPPPPSLTFRVSESNRYLTPPLTVALSPVLSGLTRGDRVTTYEWDMDGVPQKSMFGFYQTKFTEPGDHTVSLTANLLSGLTVSQTQDIQVNVNQPPVCDFTNTWQAAFKTMAFVATCTDPDGYITQYHWDFGDGDASVSSHPSERYSTPGTYTVTLTGTDNSGATTTVTRTLNVDQ